VASEELKAAPVMRAIDFEQHGREWIAAWNAHDLDRILAHYAEDVEFRSPFVAKLMGRSDGLVRGRRICVNTFRAG
jgi:ketosteroid isomerase-like protein